MLRQTPAYGANGANPKGDVQCADCRISGNREEAYVFVKLVETLVDIILNNKYAGIVQ